MGISHKGEAMTELPRAIRFGVDEAQAAADAWQFNCGPGALCAVLDKTPAEIRPHLGDFERKGYTNPKLMAEILRRLNVTYFKPMSDDWPIFGLVRVQWAGPWTRSGVPLRARYRHSHWVASSRPSAEGERYVFDVNAVCAGGWLSYQEWSQQLVPWLLRECEPKADGRWWPTHRWEVRPCRYLDSKNVSPTL